MWGEKIKTNSTSITSKTEASSHHYDVPSPAAAAVLKRRGHVVHGYKFRLSDRLLELCRLMSREYLSSSHEELFPHTTQFIFH